MLAIPLFVHKYGLKVAWSVNHNDDDDGVNNIKKNKVLRSGSNNTLHTSPYYTHTKVDHIKHIWF